MEAQLMFLWVEDILNHSVYARLEHLVRAMTLFERLWNEYKIPPC